MKVKRGQKLHVLWEESLEGVATIDAVFWDAEHAALCCRANQKRDATIATWKVTTVELIIPIG